VSSKPGDGYAALTTAYAKRAGALHVVQDLRRVRDECAAAQRAQQPVQLPARLRGRTAADAELAREATTAASSSQPAS